MRNMSKYSKHSWLLALALVAGLDTKAWAQTTPQNFDAHESAWGNAPYSNAQPAKGKPFLPSNPVGFRSKMQPFAPADISDYGNGPKPRLGYFFTYERVYWSMSKPSTTDVGANEAEGFYEELPAVPGKLIYEENSLDTDFLKNEFGFGNRFEFGYMDTNDYGWLVGVLSHVEQTQELILPSATVLFNDPQGFLGPDFQDANMDGIDDDLDGDSNYGRDGFDPNFPHDGIPDEGTIIDIPPALPIRVVDEDDKVVYIPRFDVLTVMNHTQIDGVEVMRMYRAPRLHNGGMFELLYGARLLQVEDEFGFFGSGGVLHETSIFNRALNRIVGPQLGGRYSHQRGRWLFAAEGRFLAGLNFQSITQQSRFASIAGYTNDRPVPPEEGDLVPDPDNPPPEGAPGFLGGTAPNAFNGLRAYSSFARKDEEEFAPVLELRLQSSYQFTRSIAFKIGYTAMFTDGISRGSNTIDYTAIKLGIIEDSKQDLFVQGLSLGIEFNR